MSISLVSQVISTFCRPVYSGIAHILMFHRVCQPPSRRLPVGSPLEVPPEFLEELIAILKKGGYAFVSLDELHDSLHTSHPARKMVVFTFDDGYLDNFTIAYPILQSRNIPFTIYIATSFPERTASLWWYAVDDLVFSHQRLCFSLNGEETDFDTTTPEGRIAASKFIRRTMKSATPASYPDLLKEIFTNHGIEISHLVSEMAMNWQQIES